MRNNRPHFKKPPLLIQPTTLWDYPSQHYGDATQGDPNYRGATPSYILWNLLQRYTRPHNVVVDPCCGSGTTLDVCRDLDRSGVGYDIAPSRDDIQKADARHLPLDDNSADFVFIDPPYSTHLEYSNDPACIGKLHVTDGYYQAMDQVIAEIARILKPDRHMALYVSDSYEHGSKNSPVKGFHAIGFELFAMLREHFIPVDIIAVVRHNKTLTMGNYRKAAEEQNFFLRGFNYLFIMRSAPEATSLRGPGPGAGAASSAKRDRAPRKSRPPRR